jgi:hypothetical protein
MGSYEATALESDTYTVNVFGQDFVDLLPGDRNCDAIAELPGNQCTLRAAVMEANAHDGPDRIEFIDNPQNGNVITLTIPGAGGASQGDLDVTETVVVSGRLENGRPVTTITTNKQQRLFDVDMYLGFMARFENLRLVGGRRTARAMRTAARSASTRTTRSTSSTSSSRTTPPPAAAARSRCWMACSS